MATRLVIDSTIDVTPELKNRFEIVPLTIVFGDAEYIDGIDITNSEFYDKLIESDVIPRTSQATPDAFDRVFNEAVRSGDDVVAITLSHKLSGTYQSAMIAADDYPGRVFVVDSGTASIASGVLAELALKLREDGLTAAEIAERITAERDNVRIIAMLDTLEYLKRGGRISKTVAFAGGLLSIKPVICVRDGEIIVLGKARGSKQGNNLLVKEIQAAGGVDFSKPVLLGYTGISDLLLKKYIQDSAALWEHGTDELNTTCIGSVIGTHAGPGAIAAAFFCGEHE